MNLFWAAFLGLIQGITEFLPVSSSGHLVIAQNIIPEFEQPGVLFDVVLHLATTFAVLYFFRTRLIELVKKYFLLLVIGTIPAVIVGLLLQDQIEILFGSVRMVGFALLVTGIFNFYVDRITVKKDSISKGNSFLIGIFQAVAIIPGISRSGSTIFGGVLSGVDRKKAAEFSFLLSVPAIIGANILQFISHPINGDLKPLFYVAGFIAAFISGLISIHLVFRSLAKRKFKLFSYYTFALGILVILFLA